MSAAVLERELELNPISLLNADDGDEPEDDDGYPSLFVGPALRAARLRAGVRQSAIARHLGIDSSIPSRWEGVDPIHNAQTTRYKPVPGKYFEPLASFLHCTVADLAPELAVTEEPVREPSPPPAASPAPVVHAATLSGHTLGGALSHTNAVAKTAPGRPPTDLQATGQWRRKCPGCHKVFLESRAQRAPEICDVCQTPVRARVTVTLA